MRLLLTFIFSSTLILSTEAIINGELFSVAPYFARIQYFFPGDISGQGGGSIITHCHIITSGFVVDANIFNIHVFIGGFTRSTQRQVAWQWRIPHPNYQHSPRLNDIGIIRLAENLKFDRFVQPIAIGEDFLPMDNQQGFVLGLGGSPGNRNVEILEAGYLRVVDSTRCSQRYPVHLSGQQFCAEDETNRNDICADDISGPYIVQIRGLDFLVGISSVHICNANPQARSEPSLFTRVAAFRSWIEQAISL